MMKKDAPESELGGVILGYVWSLDNADELIDEFDQLGEIEKIATGMDYDEGYQNWEEGHRLEDLVHELETRVFTEKTPRSDIYSIYG